MKKIKSLLALVLALCFLVPTLLLVACKTDSPTLDGSLSTEESIEDESSEDSSSSAPDTSVDSSAQSKPTPPKEDSSSSSSSAPAPTPPKTDNAEYIRLTGNNVNIRKGAGTSSTALGSAEKGTVYALIGKTGNWYKTYYKNQTAYIYAEYASVFTLEKNDEADVESVIEEGYKLLGVPYVYGAVRFHDGTGKLLGGFSAQKFDCSSLVQYVFYKGAGVKLGTHTRAQVKQGKFVKRADIQRGDCIYFTNEERQYNTGIERVGHVAIYLGDDYILHTSSDFARIEKLTAKRWGYYIETRRFI